MGLQAKADYGCKKGMYHVEVPVFEFKEDNIFFLYSPALDLTGYGNTKEEANASFGETLHEFLRYTTNKSTLRKVLAQLGWTVKGGKKRPKFTPPDETELETTNPTYTDILKNKDYSVTRECLELPG